MGPAPSFSLLRPGALVVLVLLAALLAAAGCSQTVVVRTTHTADSIVIDDEDYGRLRDAEELEVDVGWGLGPIPYAVTIDGETYTGDIERSEISPLFASLGAVLAVCTIPGCALLGLCAANPGLISVPLLSVLCAFGGWATALDICYSLCAQMCLRPGWLTAPFTCAGCAAGSPPLLLTGLRNAPSFLLFGPGGLVPEVDAEPEPPRRKRRDRDERRRGRRQRY